MHLLDSSLCRDSVAPTTTAHCDHDPSYRTQPPARIRQQETEHPLNGVATLPHRKHDRSSMPANAGATRQPTLGPLPAASEGSAIGNRV
jgi:hypothetical protein